MNHTSKPLTLSIIIPVFNEEIHIHRCLESIASQTRMPDEVIVVDNNSTDYTVDIAKKFSFVTIVKEKKQGIVHARNKGFNTSTSDIIGRIDADTELSPQWVETMIAAFKEERCDAVTSWAYTSFLPFVNAPKSSLFTKAFFIQGRHFMGHELLWGTSMAVTSKVWNKVKSKLATDNKVHEDQDLGFWIVASGGKSIVLQEPLVSMSGQSYRYLPIMLKYWFMQEALVKRHQEKFDEFKKNAVKLTVSEKIFMYSAVTPLLLFGIVALPFDAIGVTIFGKRKWFEFHWEFLKNKQKEFYEKL